VSVSKKRQLSSIKRIIHEARDERSKIRSKCDANINHKVKKRSYRKQIAHQQHTQFLGEFVTAEEAHAYGVWQNVVAAAVEA